MTRHQTLLSNSTCAATSGDGGGGGANVSWVDALGTPDFGGAGGDMMGTPEFGGGKTPAPWMIDRSSSSGGGQGLTLVHFSAQLRRFLWDSGCV
jgi:hypothetical protein